MNNLTYVLVLIVFVLSAVFASCNKANHSRGRQSSANSLPSEVEHLPVEIFNNTLVEDLMLVSDGGHHKFVGKYNQCKFTEDTFAYSNVIGSEAVNYLGTSITHSFTGIENAECNIVYWDPEDTVRNIPFNIIIKANWYCEALGTNTVELNEMAEEIVKSSMKIMRTFPVDRSNPDAGSNIACYIEYKGRKAKLIFFSVPKDGEEESTREFIEINYNPEDFIDSQYRSL